MRSQFLELSKKHPHLITDKVIDAFSLAEYLHDGQFRKSGHPYIVHPFEVFQAGLEYMPDEEFLMTLLLHDVLEDCKKKINTEGLLAHVQSPPVARLVKLLTNHKTPEQRRWRAFYLYLADNVDDRTTDARGLDRGNNLPTLSALSLNRQIDNIIETLCPFRVWLPLWIEQKPRNRRSKFEALWENNYSLARIELERIYQDISSRDRRDIEQLLREGYHQAQADLDYYRTTRPDLFNRVPIAA